MVNYYFPIIIPCFSNMIYTKEFNMSNINDCIVLLVYNVDGDKLIYMILKVQVISLYTNFLFLPLPKMAWYSKQLWIYWIGWWLWMDFFVLVKFNSTCVAKNVFLLIWKQLWRTIAILLQETYPFGSLNIRINKCTPNLYNEASDTHLWIWNPLTYTMPVKLL